MLVTLSSAECAAKLKCTKHHLNQLAARGEVPAAKPGKQWVFIEDEIDAWLRARTKANTHRGRPRRGILDDYRNERA